MFHLLTIATLFGGVAVQAAPQTSSLWTRQSITALSPSQISAFKPYTNFASTAYCNPSQTLTWSCGPNCDANPAFLPVASGGDGDGTQFWYVGYDPTLQSVVVSHQGTNTSEILPLLTDANAIRGSLDSTLFPGVSSSITVHDGFKSAQAKAATDVLAAVQKAMAKGSTTTVTITGHSLGAAIALLDSVYLPLHLPSGTNFKTVVYGLPRVGNQDFADYVDQNLHLTHIVNQEDPVPIVPGRFLGYHHPSGEVHIEDSGEWASCPGQDNPDTQCTVGATPNLFDSDESDHDGPYDGITMGC